MSELSIDIQGPWNLFSQTFAYRYINLMNNVKLFHKKCNVFAICIDYFINGACLI